jgi:diguanylate cyclase (GGDEF)-like protein/PAS domain S-box-containing protein
VEEERLSTQAERTLEACVEAIEMLGRAGTWRDVAYDVLELLGEAASVHRSYVYRNYREKDGSLHQEYLFEWSAPGIEPSISVPGHQTWPYGEALARWVDILGTGGTIQSNVSALPEPERGEIDFDIVSLCIVPIFVGETWWGYLGFDDCRSERSWSKVEVAALRAGAAAIGSTMSREQLDEERRTAESYLRSHLEHLPAVTYIELTNSEMELGYEEAYVSPQIQDLVGVTPEEWVGDDDFTLWAAVIHPEDRARVEELSTRTSETGEPYLDEYRMKNLVTGEYVWIRDNAHLVTTDTGKPYWHGVMIDITEQKRAEERLAYASQHDRLTDLPNRRMFEGLLDLALARAQRGNLGVAVLFLDLDNFKLVNNSLGHAAGDELIRALADRLKGALRETDIVARQGSDEFLVLLGDIEPADQRSSSDYDATLATAESVVSRIQSALSSPFDLGGTEVFATATIGISVFPSLASDAPTLLTQAGAASDRSKETGPGGYLVFSADGDTVDQLSFRTRLRKAVEDQVWSLAYQPLVESETGRMIGVEALLRWVDPEMGFISPAEFIPLAEETGLIVAIGEWVAEELFRQTREWRDRGIELEEISFNVSPRQLWQPMLVETIFGHLEASDLEAERVVIEITESASMIDPERTQRILWDLHARGFRLAIDDFGTGYSSLSRLKNMPVSILKIDRMFVKDIPEDPDAKRMVSAIVGLAKSLDMRPLAEGIETEEQMRYLVESGCELGQGYYFSRPVPASGIEEIHAQGGVTVMFDDVTP